MASVPAVVSTSNAPILSPREGDIRRARRLSRAEVLWLAFVSVQALDGAMSYIGVSLHGPAIEANPLVAWYLSALGPAVGFTAAKLFAVMCGAVLYVTARHKWVAVLTLLYLVVAVGPWAQILASSR
jgi:hypothetical protein